MEKWEKNSNMYKAKHGLILESKYLIWSLILESKNVEKRREEKGRREKEKKKKKKKKKRREEERRKNQKIKGMESLVWF